MKKLLIAGIVGAALGCGVSIGHADDGSVVMRNAAKQFATVPDGVRHPEGITANPATGEVIVGTFDFGPNENKLLRFAPNGHLVAHRNFGGQFLLGLGFDAAHGKIYILNMAASMVQRIDANFDELSAVEDVASVPSLSGFPAPNAMVFDREGNLYFSDSFQGAIFRIANVANCAPCAAELVKQDPLLATAGFPPFGANGLALDADATTLFIANTGDDRVLRMNLATRAISVFAEGVNGADGIVFDEEGRLWVAANQADEVVALDEYGQVIARLGEFQGIRRDGTPNGLLFPASIVIVGKELFVTNLALPLTEALGDEPEEGVTRWTVSRLKLPNR